MEKLTLTSECKNYVVNYLAQNFVVNHERKIAAEIVAAIDGKDGEQINWFNKFGTSVHQILSNVYAYRKQVEFGFTEEIRFGQYGWLERPAFLDVEQLNFGDTAHHWSHSVIQLGRSPKGIWTYALRCNYGTAGSSYGLTVYNEQMPSRHDAMMTALHKMRKDFTAAAGNTDTSNYKQPIIRATLRDLEIALQASVQFTLF